MNKQNKRELNEAITTANVEDKILEAIADGVTELVVSKAKFKTIIQWGIQNDVHDFSYGKDTVNNSFRRFDKVCGIDITVK